MRRGNAFGVDQGHFDLIPEWHAVAARDENEQLSYSIGVQRRHGGVQGVAHSREQRQLASREASVVGPIGGGLSYSAEVLADDGGAEDKDDSDDDDDDDDSDENNNNDLPQAQIVQGRNATEQGVPDEGHVLLHRCFDVSNQLSLPDLSLVLARDLISNEVV